MSFFEALGGLFGGGNTPDYGAAQNMLGNIASQTRPYFQPFIERGRTAGGIVNPIYERMAQDPREFIEAYMRNYSPSEGYKFKEKMLSQAARNDAAAGGFLGTPYSQGQQAELVQGLLNQDIGDYLNRILGSQQYGLGALEGQVNRGYGASTGYGNLLGNVMGQQAGLSAQSAIENAQARNQMANQGLGLFSGALRGLAGGFGGGMF